jgi:hypothetical protein
MKSSTGRTIAIRYLSDRSYGKELNDYYVGTEAMELPTVEELRNVVMEYLAGRKQNSLVLKSGYANRNPKDPFVKKTGKELALSRLELNAGEALPLNSIEMTDSSRKFNAIFNFGGFVFGLTDCKVIYIGFNVWS